MPREALNYSKLPTAEEIKTVNEYQRQLQLLSGWLPIDEDRIVYELIASSLLCVSDISASFMIPDPLLSADNSLQFERWKQFLERNKFPSSLLKKEVVNEQHLYKLDLLTFCNCLMRENRNYLTSLQPVAFFLSLLNAFIPYFFIFDNYSSLSLSSKIYYVSSGILNLVFYWVATGFLFAALEDSIRRYCGAEKLATLIRAIDIDPRYQLQSQSPEDFKSFFQSQYSQLQTVMSHSTSSIRISAPVFQISQSDQFHRTTSFGVSSNSTVEMSSVTSPVTSTVSTDGCQNSEFHCPLGSKRLPALILAEYPDNVIVWMYARKLLHNFGARVRFRLDTYFGMTQHESDMCLIFLYVGGMILLICTLIATMFYFVFFSKELSIDDLLSSPAFFALLLWVIVFTLTQAAQIFLGHLTNKTMESHG